jgi:hypothetical protein
MKIVPLRRNFRHASFWQTDQGAVTWVYAPGNNGDPIPAVPHDTEDYRARAKALGYGDDVMAMCREHEFLHSALAELLSDEGPSPTLLGVNTGKPWPHWSIEEAAVLAVQRYWNALRGRF